MKNQIFIDTDICDDIDDLWALILTLNIKNIEILGISISSGNVYEKTRFVAKLLTLLSQGSIPLFMGKSTNNQVNFHQEFIGNFSLEDYQGNIYNGFDALSIELKNIAEFTLVAIGPLTNIESMIKENYELMNKAKIILMGGAFYQGYLNESKPGAECNIVTDIDAARFVLSQLKNVVICPLDVCRDFVIDGEDYKRLLSSLKLDITLLIQNYFLWDKTYIGGAIKYDIYQSSTILYDLIPFIYLINPDLFESTTIQYEISNQGITTVTDKGNLQHLVLVNWNNFEEAHRLVMNFYLGGNN